MASRELQRRRFERRVPAHADVPQLRDPAEHGRRRRHVVERLSVGQDAAVEHAGRDHRDATLLAQRQQLFSRGAVEEGVTPSEQDTIDIAFARKTHEDRGLVHADADRTDDSFVSQPLERDVRTGERLLEMVVGIVDERDVYSVEPQPLEALVEGAPCCVVGEVENRPERRTAFEHRGRLAGTQKTPDFRRQNELLPRTGAQRSPETTLSEAGAVKRRRIEETEPERPGTIDDCVRLLVGHRLV